MGKVFGDTTSAIGDFFSGTSGGGAADTAASTGPGAFGTFPAPTTTFDAARVLGNPGTTFDPTGIVNTGGGAGAGGGLDFGKLFPAAVGGLGSLVGMLRGQGGSTDKAIKAMQQSTGPLQKVGNQELQQYAQGQLTPAQQAAVDQFKKESLAKYRQYFASAGIPESTAMMDAEAKVNQDASQYAQQLLQQNFQNAYAATGLTSSNLTNIAKMQAIQDQEQRQAWAEFMKQIGALGGDLGPIMNFG